VARKERATTVRAYVVVGMPRARATASKTRSRCAVGTGNRNFFAQRRCRLCLPPAAGRRKRTVPYTWHATQAGPGYDEVEFPGTLNTCTTCHVANTYDFTSATNLNAGFLALWILDQVTRLVRCELGRDVADEYAQLRESRVSHSRRARRDPGRTAL
jgi:hypothetical protein